MLCESAQFLLVLPTGDFVVREELDVFERAGAVLRRVHPRAINLDDLLWILRHQMRVLGACAL
jgi:hypothetical protein